MTTLLTVDRATLNASHGVIVADGRLSNALMLEHWSFAADILASKVSTEYSALFTVALNALINGSSTRSAGEQMLNAMDVLGAGAGGLPVRIP